MFRLQVSLILVACAYGATIDTLVYRRFSSKVVGGTPVQISETPHQVALLFDSSGLGNYGLRCGGSLIGNTTVITAAHCVHLTNQDGWKVRAGSRSYVSGGQLIDVVSHKSHENYNNITLDFDVAVVKLAPDLKIDGIEIKIIPMIAQDQIIPDNSPAFTSGWGPIISGGVIVEELHSVGLKIINQDLCKNSYSNINHVTENMICAGNYEEGGQDACTEDSGGPLIINGTLVGITSWGKECGLLGYPGVWARVSAFRDWIDENSL